MHGYVIRIGRVIAPLYYRGGLAFGRDPWTYELAEAAWFCSADAAQAAADTLLQWRDRPAADRAIEYHHLTDRAIADTSWRPDGQQPRCADDAENPEL
jgi:hypothetical protein